MTLMNTMFEAAIHRPGGGFHVYGNSEWNCFDTWVLVFVLTIVVICVIRRQVKKRRGGR